MMMMYYIEILSCSSNAEYQAQSTVNSVEFVQFLCETLTTGHGKVFLNRVGVNAHGRVVTASVLFLHPLLQCLQVTVCAGPIVPTKKSAQENLNSSGHADVQRESSDHPQTDSLIHSLSEMPSRFWSMQVSETVRISKVEGAAQDTPCLRKRDDCDQDYWPHRCSRRKGFTTSQSAMFCKQCVLV